MKNEIRPLTGVRGVAAFLVMLYHAHTYPPFAGFETRALSKGYLSVDLFFVLSGFVLALRYVTKFQAGGWPRYASFLRSRVARIYPAYLVIVLLYYAKSVVNYSGAHGSTYRLQDFVANLFLAQSWGFPVNPIVSDSWSVSTEAFVYLLFPLLLSLAVERGAKIAAAVALAAVGVLVAIAFSGYGVSGPLDAFSTSNRLLPLFRCLGGFCLGLVAFRASRVLWVKKILSANLAPVVVLIVLAAALSFDRTDVLTVFLFPILVICLFYNGKVSLALFGNKVVHHLGEISYSLYLLHPFFLAVAARGAIIAGARYHFSAPLLFLILGIGSTWYVAYLSYRFIEAPGRNLLSSRPVVMVDRTMTAARGR